MRRFTRVAFGAAAILAGLWMQPAALATPAGMLPATAGKNPPVVVRSSCPRLITPRCPKGYRAQCTWWVHGGPKGASMLRCCGRMGCVPSIANPMTKPPSRLPKPLPNTRVK